MVKPIPAWLLPIAVQSSSISDILKMVSIFCVLALVLTPVRLIKYKVSTEVIVIILTPVTLRKLTGIITGVIYCAPISKIAATTWHCLKPVSRLP